MEYPAVTRVCNDCSETKELTQFQEYKPGKRRFTCNACRNSLGRYYYQAGSTARGAGRNPRAVDRPDLEMSEQAGPGCVRHEESYGVWVPIDSPCYFSENPFRHVDTGRWVLKESVECSVCGEANHLSVCLDCLAI